MRRNVFARAGEGRFGSGGGAVIFPCAAACLFLFAKISIQNVRASCARTMTMDVTTITLNPIFFTSVMPMKNASAFVTAQTML